MDTSKISISANGKKPIAVPKNVLSDLVITTSDTHTGSIFIDEPLLRLSYLGPKTSYQITFETDIVQITNEATSGTPDIDVEITEH